MAGRKRFSRADWLAVGLAAIAEDGPPGLTIDAITARAGKTRGSFYAHFASMEAFLSALVAHWRECYTLGLIETADAETSSRTRLDHLNRLAVQLDPRVEQGMRRLAANNAETALICVTVDKERIAYLARHYAASPRFSSAEAEALARIEYAAFVGMQQISPDAKPDDLAALYAAFQKLVARK